MTQNPMSGRDPEADLNMGQGPDSIRGMEEEAEGPADSGAGDLGVPNQHDGGADGGADEGDGPADAGADQAPVPGHHDGGADGGADTATATGADPSQ